MRRARSRCLAWAAAVLVCLAATVAGAACPDDCAQTRDAAVAACETAFAPAVCAGDPDCLDDLEFEREDCLDDVETAYLDCVEDCGVCGDGDVDDDEDCDDGNTTGGDCCDAGCHAEPAGSPCVAEDDDEDACTRSVCDDGGECTDEEMPAPTCRTPLATGRAALLLRDDQIDDAKDALVWVWRGGEPTTQAELGDPAAATGYTLCVFDGSGLLSRIEVTAGGVCAGGRACWRQTPSGFRYVDRAGDADGTTALVLKHGVRPGAARVVFKAHGENFDVPFLDDLTSPLTLQLHRDDADVCWSGTYSFPPARRHDALRFKDRADP